MGIARITYMCAELIVATPQNLLFRDSRIPGYTCRITLRMTSHRCIPSYSILRGSLARKLPSCGRLSMASCPTIMATTSLSHHHLNHRCQSHHHHVVGKGERSGTREFTLENTLGRKNPVFFSGTVALRGRRWKVSVSAFPSLDRESGRVVDRMATRL